MVDSFRASGKMLSGRSRVDIMGSRMNILSACTASLSRVLSLGLCCLILPVTGLAAEMKYIDLWMEGDRYVLRSESFIAAPPELIFDALLDYENFHRISGGIAETRYLEPDADGTPRAYTRVESCILFFCRSVEKVERVIVVSPNEIRLEVDPEQSDFDYNQARWLIHPQDDGTRLAYELEMEPGFWIPPLIGTWVIKQKLESTAMNIAGRLEYLARTGKSLADLDIK